MKRILVFTPFAAIWPHSLLENQLLKQLPSSEFEIIRVSCKGILNSHCVVMESIGMLHDAAPESKQRVCNRCIKSSDKLSDDLSQSSEILKNTIWLDDLLSAEELQKIRSEVTNLASLNDIKSTTREGLSVPTVSTSVMYDAILKFKKINLQFSEDEIEYLRIQILNSAIVSFVATKILSQHSPDTVLIYSPQYSTNSAFAEVADQFGIPVYFIEGSSNFNEASTNLRIWKWQKYKLINPALLAWKNRPLKALTPNDIRRVGNHFQASLNGVAFSYSANSNSHVDIRKYFGIPKGNKVWLLTISSFDEAFAAFAVGAFPKDKYQSTVFENQFSWVSATIDWLERNNIENLSLIVRLHPRDLPNRREKHVAEQATIWSDLLENLPANVLIDHPKDRFPISHYFDQINGLLTGWSSTALDALMQGIPVVTYDARLPSFPPSIHITGRSRDEYFRNLKQLLDLEKSSSNMVRAREWLAYTFLDGTVALKGRMRDQKIFKKFRFSVLAWRAVSHYLPSFTRWIDTRQSFEPSPDRGRLLELLSNNLDDLFQADENLRLKSANDPSVTNRSKKRD